MWGRDTWPYVLAFYGPKNLLNRVMEGKTMLVLSSMPKLTILGIKTLKLHTLLGNWLMVKLLMCKARKLRRKTSLWRWFMVFKHVRKILKLNDLKLIHIDIELVKSLA